MIKTMFGYKTIITFFILVIVVSASLAIGYGSYDYRPTTHPGFTTVDMENDAPGQNAHDGRGLIELQNGDIILFFSNTSAHNSDGYSQYIISSDGGVTWGSWQTLQCTYDEWTDGDNYNMVCEGATVSDNGTIIVFLTNISTSETRQYSMYIRSFDNGSTWTTPITLNSTNPTDIYSTGYDAFSNNGTIYVIGDSSGGHKLYVSINNGSSFSRRSTLPFSISYMYWDIDMMKNGSLIAICYNEGNEYYMPYCISEDDGYTWSSVKTTYMAKKARAMQMVQIGDYYFIHARSGHYGADNHKGVIYTSADGINWDSGVYYDNVAEDGDWYSCNEVIHKYDNDIPNVVLVQYSDNYNGDVLKDCNVLTFFIENVSGTELNLEAPVIQSINGKTNNSIVSTSRRYFNWSKVNDTIYYHLQIANGSGGVPDWNDLIVNLNNISSNSTLNSMPGGSYTETGNYIEFYLPYVYNISYYDSHYYRVRAFAT